MIAADVIKRCQSCHTPFLVTGYQRSQSLGQALPIQCPGCFALERLVQHHQGVVHWYSRQKGFGFIRDGQGERIFVHRSCLVDRKHLRRGQRVSFCTEPGDRGPQAIQVRLVE